MHNVSFTVGIASPKIGGAVGLVSGVDNRKTGAPLTPDSRIPMGSVTKSWTAALVMQANESGLIALDEPIETYVDPVMRRLNGTTMLEIWGGDSRVHNITARLLMAMRAGIQDYNDSALWAWTWAHPDQDWTPFDMLWALDKHFVCAPGDCGEYASTGFELLGLALVHVHNLSSWTDLDQLAVLPSPVRGRYTGVAFPERGKCSKDPAICQQYRLVSSTPGDGGPLVVTFSDITNYSCLNGWSCGNIAATTKDVAQWYDDLFHLRIVSNASLMTMLQNHPLTSGWSPGLRYGLGLSWYHMGPPEDTHNLTLTVGHGGSDYGSIAHMAGYNPRFDFSISLATNSVSGMNCTDEYNERYPVVPGFPYNQRFYDDACCVVYDAVLQGLTDGGVPRLNCTGREPGTAATVWMSPAGGGGAAWEPGLPWARAGTPTAAAAAATAAVTGVTPPSAACLSEINKVCTGVRAEPKLCAACVKGSVFPDCKPGDTKDYCPPEPPEPKSVGNFTCRFAW